MPIYAYILYYIYIIIYILYILYYIYDTSIMIYILHMISKCSAISSIISKAAARELEQAMAEMQAFFGPWKATKEGGHKMS